MYNLVSLDGNKFVKLEKNGKYVYTNTESEAHYFTLEGAQNVMRNNLQSWTLKIVEIDKYHMLDYINKLSMSEYVEYDEVPLEHSLAHIIDVLDDLPMILSSNKKKLQNEEIRCARAITDLLHYKEFVDKRSASARCVLDIFESSVLKKRREIKDNLKRIKWIEDFLVGNKYKLDLCSKRYKPRELNNLFENNEIPEFDKWWKED